MAFCSPNVLSRFYLYNLKRQLYACREIEASLAWFVERELQRCCCRGGLSEEVAIEDNISTPRVYLLPLAVHRAILVEASALKLCVVETCVEAYALEIDYTPPTSIGVADG